MRLAEETILLLLDESTGYLIPLPEWKLACTLSGAVLMDLALENRIDTDAEKLVLIDSAHTGDELLDPALGEIVFETGVHSPQYWVERLAPQAEKIYERVLERLVEKKVLQYDSGGFWTLTSAVGASGLYPDADGAVREEIKRRACRILLDETEIPDPRDIMIIGLVRTCGGFAHLLEEEDLERVRERADLIARMDFIAQSISSAVESIYTPPASLRVHTRQPLPTVTFFQALRSAAFRAGNFPLFAAQQAERLGPVFRLKLPGRESVVLAGAEMNRWVNRRSRFYLRTKDYLSQFETVWGVARSIASMDGADHFRMRRAMRAGNSRSVVLDRLKEVCALARRTMGDWGIGNVLPGELSSQRLLGVQVSQLSCSVDSHEVVDDLLIYQNRALMTHVQGLLPKFMLKTPGMLRARRNILEMFAEIHSTHTTAQRVGKRRDLIDDAMELHQSDPQFLPETDIVFVLVAPLIAGHYLGSATCFALYEFLKNPDLASKVTAEADALFASGDPTRAELTHEAIDVSHRFIMEVMRLHPVIPLQLRTAMNTIEFNGMEIPAGTAVYCVHPAAHFNEEHFANPLSFDIDRYLPDRAEHRAPGAYAPFGLGTHLCLGKRFSETQLMMNLLLIAHHLELEMVPSDYELKLSPLPKLSPDKNFKFRVVRHRHPLR